MVRGELRQEAGGGLADALAQAVRGRLELAFPHFARDRPCLGHGGFAVFLRDDGLQGGGRPFPVIGRRLGEHVVVPEKLRTLDRGRPWRDSQFASTRLSPSRDMSR